MTESTDQHRQQHLFNDADEQNAEPAMQVPFEEQPELRRARVFSEATDWQPLPEPSETDLEQEAPAVDTIARSKTRPSLKLVMAGLSLMVIVILVEAIRLFNETWQQAPFEAALYGGALALILLGLLLLIMSETRKWLSLRRAGKRRNTSATIYQGEHSDDVVAFCSHMTPPAWQASLQQWRGMLNETMQDQDVLALYETEVVAQQDQAAVATIARWSSEAAVMVALSPLASLDMLLIGWRNLRMLDAIALHYNVELGWFSRWRLLKQVLINIAYAGISETVMDLGMQSIGADIAGNVSGRAAQGVGAGLLTARLGLNAVRLCRPVPFSACESPRLKHVSGHIIQAVKRRLKKATHSEG